MEKTKIYRQKSKLIEHLFTADDYGTQKMWDPFKKKALKNISGAHYGAINGMVLDPEDKYVFTYGEYGALKQWSTKDLHLIHDWGNVHEAQLQKVAVSENGILITSCDLCKVKAWDLESRKLMHEYKLPQDSQIISIVISPGGSIVFTGDKNGRLRQFLTKASSISHDNGKIHNCPITSMIISSDTKFQFTGDRFGHLKSWELTRCTGHHGELEDCSKKNTKNFYDAILFKDYGKKHEGIIYDIKFSLDDEFLQTAGGLGNLKRMKRELDEDGEPTGKWRSLKSFNKEITADDDEMFESFSTAHDAPILAISISNNGDIFTVGHKGHLKQWVTNTLNLVHDWGKVHSGRIMGAAISHVY